MKKVKVIKAAEKLVRDKLSKDGTGHDWYHVDRVRKAALILGKKEKADLFIVEVAAILHDLYDWKFSDWKKGLELIKKWLIKQNVQLSDTDSICYIIENISYKLGTNKHKMKTIEGRVVQDADRLDALGAIGIARLFAFGGFVGRPIYDPLIKPVEYKKFGLFKKTSSTSLNQFYEKLLRLRKGMNTKNGKKMAKARDVFLRKYLKQFLQEWKLKDF